MGAFCAAAGSLLRLLMMFGYYAGPRFMFCVLAARFPVFFVTK